MRFYELTDGEGSSVRVLGLHDFNFRRLEGVGGGEGLRNARQPLPCGPYRGATLPRAWSCLRFDCVHRRA